MDYPGRERTATLRAKPGTESSACFVNERPPLARDVAGAARERRAHPARAPRSLGPQPAVRERTATPECGHACERAATLTGVFGHPSVSGRPLLRAAPLPRLMRGCPPSRARADRSLGRALAARWPPVPGGSGVSRGGLVVLPGACGSMSHWTGARRHERGAPERRGPRAPTRGPGSATFLARTMQAERSAPGPRSRARGWLARALRMAAGARGACGIRPRVSRCRPRRPVAPG